MKRHALVDTTTLDVSDGMFEPDWNGLLQLIQCLPGAITQVLFSASFRATLRDRSSL
jgi:hypothetical protein